MLSCHYSRTELWSFDTFLPSVVAISISLPFYVTCANTSVSLSVFLIVDVTDFKPESRISRATNTIASTRERLSFLSCERMRFVVYVTRPRAEYHGIIFRPSVRPWFATRTCDVSIVSGQSALIRPAIMERQCKRIGRRIIADRSDPYTEELDWHDRRNVGRLPP